jgi:hypothetical protein
VLLVETLGDGVVQVQDARELIRMKAEAAAVAERTCGDLRLERIAAVAAARDVVAN